MALLVLFDVDGTLFLTSDPLVQAATLDAIEDVYGLRLTGSPMSKVAHQGRTARWITAEVLRQAGLDDDVIAAGIGDWCKAVSGHYLRLIEEAGTDHWEAPPRTAEALAAIRSFATIALLTGNPEPIARERMRRLGLDGFFPRGQGAFGCEGDERPALIDLARERAGDWPAERAVEVGDTPQDVEGAKAAGVLSVAVCWAKFSREQLAGADAHVDTMDELVEVLRGL